MRFIPSTEGPQVRDRQPSRYEPGKYQGSLQPKIDALVAEAVLELSAGELIAEHTGNVRFLPTVTHPENGELWGPTAKLLELAGVADELDALGLHRLAHRIRQIVGVAA